MCLLLTTFEFNLPLFVILTVCKSIVMLSTYLFAFIFCIVSSNTPRIKVIVYVSNNDTLIFIFCIDRALVSLQFKNVLTSYTFVVNFFIPVHTLTFHSWSRFWIAVVYIITTVALVITFIPIATSCTYCNFQQNMKNYSNVFVIINVTTSEIMVVQKLVHNDIYCKLLKLK